MNFALTAPIRPLWLHSLGWFVACAASITLAAASMPVAGGESAMASPAPAIVLLPVAIQRTVATIGVVEIVRKLQAAGAVPAGYELTVRFRDGSRRISNHADNAGWRVGDSISLIGGSMLADRI
jgi:hypothetical protein